MVGKARSDIRCIEKTVPGQFCSKGCNRVEFEGKLNDSVAQKEYESHDLTLLELKKFVV